MYGELPDWCDFTEHGGTVRIAPTDTGDSWHFRLGRATGVDPDDGEVVDELAFQVAEVDDGQPAGATSPGRLPIWTAGSGGGLRWARSTRAGTRTSWRPSADRSAAGSSSPVSGARGRRDP